jgi:hypothetical protein
MVMSSNKSAFPLQYIGAGDIPVDWKMNMLLIFIPAAIPVLFEMSGV